MGWGTRGDAGPSEPSVSKGGSFSLDKVAVLCPLLICMLPPGFISTALDGYSDHRDNMGGAHPCASPISPQGRAPGFSHLSFRCPVHLGLGRGCMGTIPEQLAVSPGARAPGPTPPGPWSCSPAAETPCVPSSCSGTGPQPLCSSLGAFSCAPLPHLAARGQSQ